MHYYKRKKDLTQGICFKPKELFELVLSEQANFISNLYLQKHANVDNQVITNSKKIADSKDYEYYVAFFDLYELFERECNFCFNLKSSFNSNKDDIRSLEMLRKYTDDPPDIIVEKDGTHYDFELKRYRGDLNTRDLEEFVEDGLLIKYSTKANYLVLLQSTSDNIIDPVIFENIHQSILKSNKDIGEIVFSFNAMNTKQFIVTVWPELLQQSRPFRTGSEVLSEILLK